MATVYYKSTAAGLNDGTSWTNAYTTLAAALTGAGAGGTVYVSQASAETFGASTAWNAGTAGSPVRVLCVDDSATPPTTLATTATITSTGNFSATISGYMYVYGITLDTSAGANVADIFLGQATANGTGLHFERCVFKPGNHSAADIAIGQTASVNNDDCSVVWTNCSIKFTNAASSINLGNGRFLWKDTPSNAVDPTGASPTNLIEGSLNGINAQAVIRGADLSHLGSGKTLFTASGNSPHDVLFENCKLGSSVALTSGAIVGPGGGRAWFINCGSDSANYRYHKQDYSGTVTHETTVVRSGGASDGTTPISRKLNTSTGTPTYEHPLISDPIEYWNETTGSSVTITVPIITDNVTLKDNEAWLEIEYLGTSGFPLSSVASNKVSALAAGSSHATDSTSTWTTTGLTTPVKQSLSVTFTPQIKGLVRARVCLAKASTTMYFDPVISSGSRQYQSSSSYTNGPTTTDTPARLSYNLGSGATTVTWTTLSSLASSATAGCQTAAISLIDGNNNVPESVDIQFTVGVGTGTIANDKCVYFWVAKSVDGGTSYEQGPPALGSTDTGYTLSTSIATVAPPFIGSATAQFQAQSTTQTAYITIVRPPSHIILVALNYCGIAINAATVKYRARYGDVR